MSVNSEDEKRSAYYHGEKNFLKLVVRKMLKLGLLEAVLAEQRASLTLRRYLEQLYWLAR